MAIVEVLLKHGDREMEFEGTVHSADNGSLRLATSDGYVYFAPGEWIYARPLRLTTEQIVERKHTYVQGAPTFVGEDKVYSCSCGEGIAVPKDLVRVPLRDEWGKRMKEHRARAQVALEAKNHRDVRTGFNDSWHCICNGWYSEETDRALRAASFDAHKADHVKTVEAGPNPNVDSHSAFDEEEK